MSHLSHRRIPQNVALCHSFSFLIVCAMFPTEKSRLASRRAARHSTSPDKIRKRTRCGRKFPSAASDARRAPPRVAPDRGRPRVLPHAQLPANPAARRFLVPLAVCHGHGAHPPATACLARAYLTARLCLTGRLCWFYRGADHSAARSASLTTSPRGARAPTTASAATACGRSTRTTSVRPPIRPPAPPDPAPLPIRRERLPVERPGPLQPADQRQVRGRDPRLPGPQRLADLDRGQVQRYAPSSMCTVYSVTRRCEGANPARSGWSQCKSNGTTTSSTTVRCRP